MTEIEQFRCKHVGQRAAFARFDVGGTFDDGTEADVHVEVCSRCFGGVLWSVLRKMPEGAAMQLSRANDELKMKWVLSEEEGT